MKKSIFLIGFILITLFIVIDYAIAETVDKIVAVVNDEPVTQSELDHLLVPIYEQYQNAYSGQEFIVKMNEARTNLLNQLIEDRLIAQEAARLGVTVGEEEVDARVEEVRSKFATDAEFKTFLEEQRISLLKLRARYKEQIAIRKLHQYEIRQKVIVSPKDVEDYYTQHLSEFTEKEKIKVRTIMVRKNEPLEDGSDPVAREKIESLVKDLKDGADFSETAKQFSDETHAAEGGELGSIQRGELIKTFDSVLFDLSVGALSPILETEIGYHLFFIDAKQEKKVKPLAELKSEIESALFRLKSKERFTQWITDLKEDAYISIK